MTNTDPSQELTIAELDAGSRLLKGDMLSALSTDSRNRPAALAMTAWLLARRTDRSAQLNTYRAMTISELTVELGGPDEDDPSDAPMVVTDRQIASAAGELGLDFTELATALGLDAVEPVEGPHVDELPTDEQLLDDEDQVAGDPELAQLVEDPTAPAPEPSSPGPGEPTP